MSYLLDKKNKNKKIMLAGVIIIILIASFLLRSPLSYFFSRTATSIAAPFWKIGKNIKENFSGYTHLLKSKKTLLAENEDLKDQILKIHADVSLNSVLSDENAKLKDILGRKSPKRQLILASILSKPNRSAYDSLVVDIGTNDGVSVGQKVFAHGNILMGEIVEVFPNLSKVKLFSTGGEKIEVVFSGSDIYLLAVGRGGGGFDVTAPRDLHIEEGMEVFAPGMEHREIAVVAGIVSDQRSSFQKVILRSPVNIQELKWVEIEK